MRLSDTQLATFGLYELSAARYEVLCVLQGATGVADPELLSAYIDFPLLSANPDDKHSEGNKHKPSGTQHRSPADASDSTQRALFQEGTESPHPPLSEAVGADAGMVDGDGAADAEPPNDKPAPCSAGGPVSPDVEGHWRHPLASTAAPVWAPDPMSSTGTVLAIPPISHGAEGVTP